MKYLPLGINVRRKRPYFDNIYHRMKKRPYSIEDYYSQVGTVIQAGDATARVKWSDGRVFKYGVSVLERVRSKPVQLELFEYE